MTWRIISRVTVTLLTVLAVVISSLAIWSFSKVLVVKRRWSTDPPTNAQIAVILVSSRGTFALASSKVTVVDADGTQFLQGRRESPKWAVEVLDIDYWKAFEFWNPTFRQHWHGFTAGHSTDTKTIRLIEEFGPKKQFTQFRNQQFIRLPYWCPIFLSGLWPALSLRRYLRSRRRKAKGLCTSCGYDLRASSGQCPECGTPIPSTQAPAQVTSQ